MISRRTLLFSAASLSGAVLLLPLSIRAVMAQEMFSANSDTTQFYQLSLFLTARPALSQNVSLRALTMLTAEDAAFPEKMSALWQQIRQQKLTSVDQLAISSFYQQPALKSVGQKIISAWYLGYTGTPIEHRAVDNTRLVTYTKALMFESTADVTAIPSYSRGKTNYWTQPPTTINND